MPSSPSASTDDRGSSATPRLIVPIEQLAANDDPIHLEAAIHALVLMLGRDDGDPLFLQVKEAQPSVLEPHLGRSTFANHGRRVVEGQRLMQPTSDLMLGWIRSTEWIDGVDRDFYVRQLWDGKGSVPVQVMDAQTLAGYGELCGWALARAHAADASPSGRGSE